MVGTVDKDVVCPAQREQVLGKVKSPPGEHRIVARATALPGTDMRDLGNDHNASPSRSTRGAEQSGLITSVVSGGSVWAWKL